MILINNATEDTSSDTIEATGPIIVSVVGRMRTGRVRITADIGSGESTVFVCTSADTIRMDRIELAEGLSFKAYLEGTNDDDTNVTVEYINV
jgi:hypothetical protein